MKRIRLTRGKYALVDDEDYVWLSAFKWYANKASTALTYYVHRQVWIPSLKGQRQVAIQNAIMKPPPGFEVDHIDRNGLNNQRRNLRVVTHSENCRNKTQGRFKGFTRNKQSGRWISQVPYRRTPASNKRMKYLGTFATKAEAVSASRQFLNQHQTQL